MHRISMTLAAVSLALPVAFAQQSSSSLIAPALMSDGGSYSAGTTIPASETHPGGFPGVGVAAKVGLLGIGFEAAVPVAYRLNVRAGGNFFNYNDTLTSSGITYNAELRFRSAEASVDWFPWGKGLHVSPGALLYNGNQVTGGAHVPAGQTFTLNDQTYTSGATDPVTGVGGLTMNKVAPKLTVGWGDIVPRSERHFSFPFEVGFAYIGDPKFDLTLAGTACYTYQGTPYCDNVATDANIQANLAAERKKIANDAADARFFPLISQGFAVRF